MNYTEWVEINKLQNAFLNKRWEQERRFRRIRRIVVSPGIIAFKVIHVITASK